MNRTPDHAPRTRRVAEPVELTTLRGWLRGKKAAAAVAAKAEGKRATFQYLADRASAGGNQYAVSACTLRQALDGRLPTLRTTLAFTYGAGCDEKDLKNAERLWAAARRAVNGPAVRCAPPVLGRFTTQAGLVRAMNRLRAGAPHPSLRALAEQAGPGLSRSTIHRILTGRQMPTTAQLTAFATACHASEEATDTLLAGHRRILAGPQPYIFYPCAYAELAEERRQRDEAARPWLAEPELDWYQQQLRDEEEADLQRQIDEAEAHLDELKTDTWRGLDPGAVRDDPDADLAKRAQPVYDTWIGRGTTSRQPGTGQP
ncbi:helix-turn-helix domain-containing protein [Streptomyces erythrochromogenes]|uniref:helix-turn-helix domain-containing protein n=1 Tax=Streptomyces erythrochromogenes TaxID=285574 RepID=UPI00386B654E|nr:helix-turn-helix domain-containing protein [Streptomyces erythrochromogenes]WSR88273.1 helix-turn-helix domain-containing protein [Streptomyces erythrochromogenes]